MRYSMELPVVRFFLRSVILTDLAIFCNITKGLISIILTDITIAIFIMRVKQEEVILFPIIPRA